MKAVILHNITNTKTLTYNMEDWGQSNKLPFVSFSKHS